MPDDELAALLVLLRLGGIGPARSRWLLAGSTPVEAVAALRRRTLPVRGDAPPGVTRGLVDRWFSEAARDDGAEVLEAHRRAGVTLLTPGHECWPFTADPEPPAVLFALGSLSALDRRLRAAIVGTRRCTSVGRRAATGFGAELTSAGVSVVSGLALGIDGAAHRGALASMAAPGQDPSNGESHPPTDDAPPVAVVASGLDVVYPRGNADVWHAVGAKGLVLSEAPLGTSPERWRFPARNRLIAGLADVVVVIESHLSGGALLTADEAAVRGVPVLAVPGSVASAAAEGTNSLLMDGCVPVRSASDVLDLLGLSRAADRDPQRSVRPDVPVSADDPFESLVLAEVASGPTHMDTLVALSGRPVDEVLMRVQRLALEGRVALDGNWVGGPDAGPLELA